MHAGGVTGGGGGYGKKDRDPLEVSVKTFYIPLYTYIPFIHHSITYQSHILTDFKALK